MSASLFYEKVKRQDVSARWTCEDGQAYSVRTVYTVILFYYNIVQPYAVKTIKKQYSVANRPNL